MQAAFSGSDPDRGQLFAQRALLGLWRPLEGQISIMTAWRALALVALAITLPVDGGISDARRGEGAALWFLYGTSAAQLNMIPYYVLALRLSFYKTISITLISDTPEPTTPLASATWFCFASGTVCLSAAFLVYELALKQPDRRESEEPILALNFFFCISNLLFGNTPLLPKQVLAPLLSACLYFLSLAAYEFSSGQQLYDMPLAVFVAVSTFAVVVCFGVLGVVLEVRERCAPSLVWREPPKYETLGLGLGP